MLCSCLQINDDFALRQDENSPTDAQRTSTAGETMTRDAGGVSEEGVVAETNQDHVSSEPSSGGDSGSTNDSSSTTSLPPSALWIPIAVRNQSPGEVLGAQTSVRLQFDHAALVSAQGAKMDGSNVQIFVSDGSTEQELDRVLDPGSRWNDAQTQIWFAVNAEIPGGQSQDRRYYLVVHPSSSSPKADPQRVFLAYDHFDAATLNSSMWAASAKTEGPGSQAMELRDGELILTASASAVGERAQTVRSVANWQIDAIAMDASVRTNSNLSMGANCTQEFLVGFWAPSPSTYIRSLYLHDRQGYRFANHRDVDPFDFILQNTGERLTSSGSRRYSMRWTATQVDVLVPGSPRRIFFPRFTSFTRPAHGPLIAGFEAVALGGCPGVQSLVAVDWVIVRKAAPVEPSIILQVGQATRREL